MQSKAPPTAKRICRFSAAAGPLKLASALIPDPQRRRRFWPPRPRPRVSSYLTFSVLPPNVLPSSPAIAALASCPSISMNPKPRHRPVNTSEAICIDRTVPNSENSARTASSEVSFGKPPTNILFKTLPRHSICLSTRRNRLAGSSAATGGARNSVGERLRVQLSTFTCAACNPFGPFSTSKLTVWPSVNDRYPPPTIAE